MRIGFDAKRIFQNSTGLGNYSRTIVKDLAVHCPQNDYYLFTARHNTRPELPAELHIVCPEPVMKSYWRSLGIKKDLRKYAIDIYHGLSNEIPFALRKTRIKTVVTVHDVIFKHFPHQYPFIDRMIYHFKTRYACKNANRIIAVSQATKNDLIKFYNVSEDKIDVIYQNCSPDFYHDLTTEQIDNQLSALHLPDRYVLYVGSVSERKNLLGLCKALLLIPPALRLSCIVAGRGGAYAEKVKKFIAEHGLSNHFIFLENIEDAVLPALYKKACCFIYPGFYEGFGIPVLEAMASGCPVVCSKVASLPEVGGSAALYFNPYDLQDMATKISDVTTSEALRQEMVKKGAEQVKKFDGIIIAEQIANLYKNL